MAEKSFPFDAVNVDGVPDRVFYSADFASMFEKFFVSGIYPNPSDCLQVISGSGMVLKVRPGAGYIKGRVYSNDADIDIAINTANANYARKDIIVLRLDLTERDIKVLYRPGTATSHPIAPELVRTDDIHDLKLAEVFVGSGVSVIQQSNIIDCRMDNTVCGYVDNTIKNVDTTTIFNQYAAKWQEVLAKMDLDEDTYNAWWSNFVSTAESVWGDFFSNTQNDWNGWFNQVKADIFDAKYFDFDNFTYRDGMTYSYTESSDPLTFVEFIKTTSTDEIYAQRVSVANVDETEWTVTTTCSSLDINFVQKWQEQPDGTWIGGIINA